MKLNPHQQISKYWAKLNECPVISFGAHSVWERKRTQGLIGEEGSPMASQRVASPERGMEPARCGGASAWAPAGLWSSTRCHQPLPCLHSQPNRLLKLSHGSPFITLRAAKNSSVFWVISWIHALIANEQVWLQGPPRAIWPISTLPLFCLHFHVCTSHSISGFGIFFCVLGILPCSTSECNCTSVAGEMIYRYPLTWV